MDSRWACQKPLLPFITGEQEQIWLALQISEDTCAAHSEYLCSECFDVQDEAE